MVDIRRWGEAAEGALGECLVMRRLGMLRVRSQRYEQREADWYCVTCHTLCPLSSAPLCLMGCSMT